MLSLFFYEVTNFKTTFTDAVVCLYHKICTKTTEFQVRGQSPFAIVLTPIRKRKEVGRINRVYNLLYPNHHGIPS